jgi:hypothetical protein
MDRVMYCPFAEMDPSDQYAEPVRVGKPPVRAVQVMPESEERKSPLVAFPTIIW